MADDLKRFGINVVVVREYSDIVPLLERIVTRFRRRTVFISGSVSDYAPWDREKGVAFLAQLGRALVSEGFRVVTGMGLGLGDAVISGIVPQIYAAKDSYVEDLLISRPFPQAIDDLAQREQVWASYREDLIAPAGISLFLYGNKLQGNSLVLADGMRKEFDIARGAGSAVVPVGATGHMAHELWREVVSAPGIFFDSPQATLIEALGRLGDPVADPMQLIEPILTVLRILSERN